MTHQIGRCTAPCVKLIEKEVYRVDINAAIAFLRGKNKKVLQELTTRRKSAAHEERFELAGKLRDSIASVRQVLERQAVVNDSSEIDQDVIGFHGGEAGTLLETIHIRQGRVIGNRSHFLPMLDPSSSDEDIREWMTSFINQYYVENIVPDEVLLTVDLGGDLMRLLEAVLKERGGHEVQVRFPTDEGGHKLLRYG